MCENEQKPEPWKWRAPELEPHSRKPRAPELEPCHCYDVSADLAINALYVVFWAFVMNCENLEFIWLKFHKFPNFNNIINSKWNGIDGEKLVRPAIPCRVCFWPTTKERLPTLALALTSTFIKKYFQVGNIFLPYKAIPSLQLLLAKYIPQIRKLAHPRFM